MRLYEWIKRDLGLDGEEGGRYYVYELLDRRFTPPLIFYVGMGQGKRMFDHATETKKLLLSGRGAKMKLRPKHKRIVEIWDAGMDVGYQVIFRSHQEWEALMVEAYDIEFVLGIERLTNETYGYSAASIEAVKKRALLPSARTPRTIYAPDELEVLPEGVHGGRELRSRLREK